MPKLTKLVPAGEAAVWMSPTASRAGPLIVVLIPCMVLSVILPVLSSQGDDISAMAAGAVILPPFLLIAGLMWIHRETEVAVTERQVIWRRTRIRFRRAATDNFGEVALDRVRGVDVHVGSGDVYALSSAVVLDLDGGETLRIAHIAAGGVEEMAAAMKRPARVWRQCRSANADRARWWKIVAPGMLGMAVYVASTLTFIKEVGYSAFYIVEPGSSGWLSGFSWLPMIASVLAVLIAVGGRAILPHLLVGRRLPPEERRDFVCTLVDPLWNGKERDPDGPRNRWFHRLETWVMRKTYGEIPDCSAIEPRAVEAGHRLPADKYGDDPRPG